MFVCLGLVSVCSRCPGEPADSAQRHTSGSQPSRIQLLISHVRLRSAVPLPRVKHVSCVPSSPGHRAESLARAGRQLSLSYANPLLLNAHSNAARSVSLSASARNITDSCPPGTGRAGSQLAKTLNTTIDRLVIPWGVSHGGLARLGSALPGSTWLGSARLGSADARLRPESVSGPHSDLQGQTVLRMTHPAEPRRAEPSQPCRRLMAGGERRGTPHR